MYFILCVLFNFGAILFISSYEKPVWFFVFVNTYCVGSGITTLMSISDGLDPIFFQRKMERTRSMKEKMVREVFISRQSRHFSFMDNLNKVLFPICTLNWRVNIMFPSKEKVKIGETKVLLLLYNFVASGTVLIFSKTLTACFDWNLSFILRVDIRAGYIIKIHFSLHNWQNFSLRFMATLRNKKKLAAVSRETPENTRNSQSQNTLDPGMAQEYISQVSEQIEGRVIKKLSKEFSRKESRNLGALSKLDELLLNPQFWTCSVAVPGTSRNNDSENWELTGDRCLGDPCPEAVFSTYHSSNLNDSEQEETHHNNVFVCLSNFKLFLSIFPSLFCH